MPDIKPGVLSLSPAVAGRAIPPATTIRAISRARAAFLVCLHARHTASIAGLRRGLLGEVLAVHGAIVKV